MGCHFLLQGIFPTQGSNLRLLNCRGFPGGSEVKASAFNAWDPGLIPASGRSPGEGNGNPLQYSCLENPMDGGAWWATVHGRNELDVTEWLHSHFLCCWAPREAPTQLEVVSELTCVTVNVLQCLQINLSLETAWFSVLADVLLHLYALAPRWQRRHPAGSFV